MKAKKKHKTTVLPDGSAFAVVDGREAVKFMQSFLTPNQPQNERRRKRNKKV